MVNNVVAQTILMFCGPPKKGQQHCRNYTCVKSSWCSKVTQECY